jgi:acyl carrier protein
MHEDTYRDSLLRYVSEVLLKGDGQGLTADTPLLELGIIDSFSFFAVLAFVENEFGISIAPGELNAEQLGSVNAIARTLAERSREG